MKNYKRDKEAGDKTTNKRLKIEMVELAYEDFKTAITIYMIWYLKEKCVWEMDSIKRRLELKRDKE